MELEQIRKQVDLIDAELIRLLNKRMELAVQTRRFKTDVVDGKREEQILQLARSRSQGLIAAAFSEKLFSEIISESRSLQEAELKLVGFQGEHGAYSEIAARVARELWIPIPCADFADVFESVSQGAIDVGVVPVENSIEGQVAQVTDLLIETQLTIVEEVAVPIRHCLLTLPDADHREIRTVWSHPQALGQCRGFLQRQKLESRAYYDTAGAALTLVRERPKGVAVIARKLCADIYGLEVIKEGIEDNESNTTRFLLISKTPALEPGDKCSLVFATANRAGALFDVIKLFSDRNINLTRIESRPKRSDPGNVAFLLDFLGNVNDPKITEVLAEVEKVTSSLRILGCYKRAQ